MGASSTKPTVAIIGPGALGTLFAARFAQAGIATMLLDHRPARAQQLNESGLSLRKGTAETHVHVPVSADPTKLADIDYVLLLVKSYQTEDASATLAEYLPKNAAVLTLQNGLGNVESMQAHLGPQRVWGGTTAQGALLEAPGIVTDTGEGPTVIGRPDGIKDARTEPFATLLLQAGFSVAITDDLSAALWSKVILNAAINPVGALTRLRNGELAATDYTLKLMTATAREAAKIALKHGVKLPETDWRTRLLTVCQATANNQNSMLQDVLNCRQTEIDAINAAIVRIADQHQIPAPINRSLWYLIKGLTG
ncbi:MAG: 2-dehydropantoate 2-reductase [bacterium]